MALSFLKLLPAFFPRRGSPRAFSGKKGERAQQTTYQQVRYRRPQVLHVDDVQAEGEIQRFKRWIDFANWFALVHQGLAVDDQAQAD